MSKAKAQTKPQEGIIKEAKFELEAPDLSTPLGETGVMFYKGLLNQKLLNVTSKIGVIAKKGRNTFSNYDFIGHEQVSTALRGILVEEKLVLSPEVVSYESESFISDKKKTTVRTTIHMEIEIIDADTGFSIIKKWIGREQDTSGKDFQQAVTTTYKYWQFKQFLITDKESSSDPDSKTSEIPQGAKPVPASPKAKDPFFEALPKHFWLGKQDNGKNWATDANFTGALNLYLKEPSIAKAMEVLGIAKDNYKWSKEKYKKLLIALNLVDENGKEKTT